MASLREIIVINHREVELYTYTIDSLTWYRMHNELGYVSKPRYPLPVPMDVADTACNWHWLQDLPEHEPDYILLFVSTFLEQLTIVELSTHASRIDRRK